MGWLTRDELRQKLIDLGKPEVADKLDLVADKFSDHSLKRMEELHKFGYLREYEWEAYCYLWRNVTFRHSTELQEYELSATKT